MARRRRAVALAAAAALGGARAQRQATQAEVLSYLYRTTGGPEWRDSTNWLVGDPCTPGAGWMSSSYYDCLTGELTDSPQPVCCEIVEAGADVLEVVKLDLYNNNLVGTIPPELALLPYLRMLVLDENQLSGTVPTQIGKLVDMNTLWLQYNSLSGSLPAELANLDKIVDHGCYLHNNSFAPVTCTEPPADDALATSSVPAEPTPINLPAPCLTPYLHSPTGYLGAFDIPCAHANLTFPPPPPPKGRIRSLAAGVDGGVVVVLSIVGGAALLVILNELSKYVRRRLAARQAAKFDAERPAQEMNVVERLADEEAEATHKRAQQFERANMQRWPTSSTKGAGPGRPTNAFTHPMSDDDGYGSRGSEWSACGATSEEADGLSVSGESFDSTSNSASGSEGRGRRAKAGKAGGRRGRAARFDGHV